MRMTQSKRGQFCVNTQIQPLVTLPPGKGDPGAKYSKTKVSQKEK